MPVTALTRLDAERADAASLLERHSAHVIYKHSPYCSLSFIAEQQVRRYADVEESLPVTLVDVIGQRAMSNAIEAATGVRHESPQVLLVRDGRVAWHTSHRGVTMTALTGATTQGSSGA